MLSEPDRSTSLQHLENEIIIKKSNVPNRVLCYVVVKTAVTFLYEKKFEITEAEPFNKNFFSLFSLLNQLKQQQNIYCGLTWKMIPYSHTHENINSF